jgi:P pilus assembly chaperone PapD
VRLRLVGGRAAKTGVAWCALGRLAGAQVAGIGVDPHMVVLTATRPAGEITVLNPHATRAEFSVDLRFGYATTDAAGQLRVELNDEPDNASAASWVVPYPNRFILRPGGTRKVRLLARPPATLADGEYWARITVHARDDASSAPALEAAIDTSDATSARVRIAMETATVLPVFFRKGAVSTGIAIGSADAVARRGTIDVRATLTRNGNSAFIGIAHLVVHDSSGHLIATADRQIAVYRTMRPRWTIAIPPGASLDGNTVAVSLSTDRHDVPRNLLLQAGPVATVIPARREGTP